MAFAFFRRRQKMVVVIMAVLMVSFLVGMQGFKMLTETDRSKEDYATTRADTITIADMHAAEMDLKLISPYGLYGVRDVNSIIMNPLPGEMEFFTLSDSQDPALLYVLLLKEAEAANIIVTDADVENHFRLVGRPISSPQYENLISQMQIYIPVGSNRLEAAVKHWLKVYKSYIANMANTPPSEPEIRQAYRDLSERIDLRIVELSAEDFVKDVAEPGDEEIAEYFEKYKTIVPGTITGPEDFGFGYSQPDRSRVQYLLLKGEVMLRVTRPGDDKLRKYFISNRDEFVSKVPIEPAADQQPATAPTTQPVEYRIEPKSFAEAKPDIIMRLQGKAIEDKVKDVLARARSLMEGFESDDPLASPYEWVLGKMTHLADVDLSRKIEAVRIQGEPLDSAMEILAQAAGLNAICYPYGKTTDSELDPNVKVTFSATDITLGDALKNIGKQIQWEDIEWAICDGFGGVIFPADDATGLFPLAAGDSGLIDANEMAADEILSASYATNGYPLVMLSFQTKSELDKVPLMEVGEHGSQMMVLGPKHGDLIWRMVAWEAAHTPAELTDDIRADVIKDIKLAKAMALAARRAEELIAAAQTDGLEAAAKAADLESTTTDLFARRRMSSPTQTLLMALQAGYDPAKVFRQILKVAPVELNLSSVPGIELATSDPNAGLTEAIMAKAFSLVPEKIEPDQGDDPYPDKPYAMTSMNLPAGGTVLVLQREDYRPPVASDFQQGGRAMIARALSVAGSFNDKRNWFDLDQAKKRLGYKPVTKPENEH